MIEQKLRFCTTLGGYEATPEMQLLDADFKPVENFYAADNCNNREVDVVTSASVAPAQ